jgi:hypothetical protein
MKPALRIIFAPLAARYRDYDHHVRPTQGTAAGRTIRLDPRMADVGKTLFHEWLHVQHPSWSEERVRAEEERQWLRMTWKRKAALYKMLGSALIEGEMTA